jgi:hypothetical protein
MRRVCAPTTDRARADRTSVGRRRLDNTTPPPKRGRGNPQENQPGAGQLNLVQAYPSRAADQRAGDRISSRNGAARGVRAATVSRPVTQIAKEALVWRLDMRLRSTSSVALPPNLRISIEAIAAR